MRGTVSAKRPHSPFQPEGGHVYQLHSGSGSSHQTLARLARQFSRSPVLDVGAAEGYLGQLLAGSGLDLDALEPSEQYAAIARPLLPESLLRHR